MGKFFSLGKVCLSGKGKSFTILPLIADRVSGTIFAWRRVSPDRPGCVVHRHRRGATLPELMMLIAIVAILASLGLYSARDSIAHYRMIRTARLLQTDIQLLRALAVNTNRQTRLKLVSADVALDPTEYQQGEWLLQLGNRPERSTEWDTLPVNKGTQVVDEEGERSLAVGGAQETPWISLAAWTPLTGPGLDCADAIVFSPRGWLDNPPLDFTNGYIELTVVNKRAMLSGGTERVSLKVTRGGLARMELGEKNTLPNTLVGAPEASTP